MSEINDISDFNDLPEPPNSKSSAKGGKGDKNDKAQAPIIVKRIKKGHGGHHGGSWKIAYADFVTAMMAFFLLMWLISSLNKAQKAGLSEYFRQPMKVALIGGDSMGNREMKVLGGGENIEAKDGQVAKTNTPTVESKIATEENVKAAKESEIKNLEDLKSNINLSLEKDPSLAGLKKQLLMDNVHEGLRIQLIDNQNKPMFDTGSDKMNPQMEQMLAKIAKILNSMPNKIAIQGHTDAHPYHNPDELDFTNWELSTERANTARRALIKAGMAEDKVLRVSGYASTVLLNKNDPYDPKNRRISIIVLKKDAEEALLKND